MLQRFCWYFLGKIHNINIAYFRYKIDRKTQWNDMSFGSDVHSMAFQMKLIEEKFNSNRPSIKFILR